MSAASELSAKIKSWRESPSKFVHEELGVEPDAWQLEALDAFASNDPSKQRLSFQACAGPGKTAVEAWIGLNFLVCYAEPGEHPKGAAVATTYDNLRDNLWPEFAKWIQRSKFLSKMLVWTKERIFARDHPETWFLSARSWSKTANAEEQGRTLSGLHSKYVLILIDESGDIPLTILKTGEQALSNCKFGKIVQAGNPTSLDGMLYAAATTHRHLWHVIRITGDPDDPSRSKRIDIEWAREQIRLYGRHDPWVMSYLLGMFPPSSINVLIGPEEVELAMKRIVKPEEYSFAQKRLGVDVARFGDDKTCLCPRQGIYMANLVKMRNARTNEIGDRMLAARAKWKHEIDFVDDTGGYGAGVIDYLLLQGQSPTPVNFGGRATDPRYDNKISEMAFLFVEWIKRGGRLPNDTDLARQLTTRTYTFKNGKFALEPKDQYKKRMNNVSPDEFDSACLTFATPDMPSQEAYQEMPLELRPRLIHEGNTAPGIASDYDPYDPNRL